MSCEKSSVFVFVIGWTILAILGCGGNMDGPNPPTSADLMLMEKLDGGWDVISVNDMEPARFLTVLMVMDLNASDDGIAEEGVVPAAPRAGEFVIIEDELQEVYDVKTGVDNFHYTFRDDNRWTLQVQFDVVPNDEVPPTSDASDPGEGQDDPPPDPNKPAAPANETPEVIAVVVGTWSGTYTVSDDALLSLNVDVEEVKVTPHPDVKAFFKELTDDTGTDTQTELTRKFRIRLITPFSKTYISIDDDGRLTFTVPGSSRGKMVLEKR